MTRTWGKSGCDTLIGLTREEVRLLEATWLDEAIARVRAEDFPAVPSGDCRTCPYVSACPAQPEGREVLA